MAQYIYCRDTTTTQDVAHLYVSHIWKFHRTPDSIGSDLSTTFTSHFSTSLCDTIKIQGKMSTAFHPQTDGQTEHVNTIMEQYLHGYVRYQQDN